MIRPDYLMPGDKIGIVAPARKVTPQEMENGLQLLRNAGFEIVLGKNLYGEDHQFSGTDNERAADLQHMIDDHEIKAIMCARGGYGMLRIIDHIDFAPLVEYPKWLIGFSDITALHSHAHTNIGLETIHADMLINFQPDLFNQQSFDTLIQALTGAQLSYEWQTPEHLQKLNRNGKMTAELVGGNLSLLYANNSTASDLDCLGKILFIEDIEEYLYHIDRMMVNLKRSGKLENIAALVVGGMTNMNDNKIPFGKTAEEIIYEHVREFEIPIVFGFPAGHQSPNLALILGREVELVVGETNMIRFLDNDE
jgi:muramoyltetrapeptide carboxypeptidase